MALCVYVCCSGWRQSTRHIYSCCCHICPTHSTLYSLLPPQVCYVPGVTLFLDFPFPAFPDNLGHWAEVLLPLYSALSSTASWRLLLQGNSRYIDRLLLLNVRQQLLYSWPREVLGLALNPALPPWPATADADGSSPDCSSSSIGSGDSSSSSSSKKGCSGSSSRQLGWHESLPWDRPLPQIINPVDYDAWSASGWLVFENVVVLYDRCVCVGGGGGVSALCFAVASGSRWVALLCLSCLLSADNSLERAFLVLSDLACLKGSTCCTGRCWQSCSCRLSFPPPMLFCACIFQVSHSVSPRGHSATQACTHPISSRRSSSSFS